MNRVILIGNLTRDFEVRYTASKLPIGKCGIAVNSRYTNKDGKQIEETLFIDFTIFGSRAEQLQQRIGKGSRVALEGRLVFDTWEKDGQRRSRHSIIADRIEMLGCGNSEESKKAQEQTEDEIRYEAIPAAGDTQYKIDNNDEIPF